MSATRNPFVRKWLPRWVVAVALGAGVAVSVAQTKRNRANQEFMRDKLALSQQVLEGLAIEDFDLIAAKGARLAAMSREADWRVFENPDYEQQSAIFRRHVDSLAKAAKDRNLDAATLAYVRITMSCVDCHKLVRGKLVAKGPSRAPEPDALLALRHLDFDGPSPGKKQPAVGNDGAAPSARGMHVNIGDR